MLQTTTILQHKSSADYLNAGKPISCATSVLRVHTAFSNGMQCMYRQSYTAKQDLRLLIDLCVSAYIGTQTAHLKWAQGLASSACSNLDLTLIVLKERAKNVSTSVAIELHHLELRKHSCPSCHYPLELDETVQVMLPANSLQFTHIAVTAEVT